MQRSHRRCSQVDCKRVDCLGLSRISVKVERWPSSMRHAQKTNARKPFSHRRYDLLVCSRARNLNGFGKQGEGRVVISQHRNGRLVRRIVSSHRQSPGCIACVTCHIFCSSSEGLVMFVLCSDWPIVKSSASCATVTSARPSVNHGKLSSKRLASGCAPSTAQCFATSGFPCPPAQCAVDRRDEPARARVQT
jgi:hypothetical protein